MMPDIADLVEDSVHITNVRASRQEAGKRTTFYSVCQDCRWVGPRRSSASRESRDGQAHGDTTTPAAPDPHERQAP